jgi:predicted alpha/beta-fold hydrolase
MRYLWTVLLAVTLVAGATSKAELIKFSVSSYILPNKELSMSLDIVMPRSASTYTPIIYLTGLSGLLPSTFQEKLIDSVAEENFIWITVTMRIARSRNCKARTLTKSPT